MPEAFSSDETLAYHPICRGRRPHLRDFEKDTCQYKARTMLLAASNSWFPLVFNTLSIPTAVDTLGQLIEVVWNELSDVEGTQDLAFLRRRQALERMQLSAYSDEELWARIEQQKHSAQDDEDVRPFDLKIPEWEVLSQPENAPRADDFEVTPVSVPDGYTRVIQQVVLVEKLREVRALTGFTRIESLSDYAEEEELPTEHIMPLSRHAPHWVPAAEVRGEGIFLQFREDAIQAWLKQLIVGQHDRAFYEAHYRWRIARHISHQVDNFPGIR